MVRGSEVRMNTLRCAIGLLMCLGVHNAPGAAPLANTLRGNPSPYLALHGGDPVAWQVWGQAVLDRARAEHKLIYMSVGYFSCHWCHVMQRESYQNPAVAQWLNAHFIAVKVDRELDPSLDAYLVNFLERTRGHSGWPLNVFLTPDGYPVVGLVYQPQAEFLTLLQQLQGLWASDRSGIESTAKEAALHMAAQAPPAAAGVLSRAVAERLENTLLDTLQQGGDLTAGGFGEQTKFPMTAHLRALLAAYARGGHAQLRPFLELTLDQMASQGLRDHLGGGFFRYTVDPTWQTPHFEKMLYDNALMASLYAAAAQVLGRPDYQDVARETLDFLLHTLRGRDGGFVASLSAVDGSGVEGGYYLWSEAELSAALTAAESKLVRRVYRMEQAAVFDAGYLPIPRASVGAAATQLGVAPEFADRLLAQAKDKLLRVRAARSLPVDTKQLAAWNGLTLSALAEGARWPDGASYRAAGQALRDYLVHRLWNGKELSRARGPQGPIGQASLEDYAYVAGGLMAWVQLTGDKATLATLVRLLDVAWTRYFDARGWRHTDTWLLPQQPTLATLEDGALPSASAMLIRVTLWAQQQTGDMRHDSAARRALALGLDRLTTAAGNYPSHIALISDAVLGSRDAPRF